MKPQLQVRWTLISTEFPEIKTGQIELIPICPVKVGKTGFEPATPWSQTRCATGLRYFPKIVSH